MLALNDVTAFAGLYMKPKSMHAASNRRCRRPGSEAIIYECYIIICNSFFVEIFSKGPFYFP